MNTERIYSILRDVVATLSSVDPNIRTLPEKPPLDSDLSSLGLDIVSLPEIIDDFQKRIGGKDLKMQTLLSPDTLNAMTLGRLIETMAAALQEKVSNPIVVYVDDEEENLFIFKRRFQKHLNLKTFSDPREALKFILASPDVLVVLTDEVMPNLSGNALCDEVKKFKPTIKFILITGNPNSDGDLMHNTLRFNRFYEFLNKPVDFEGKGDEYLAMIQGLLHFSW